MSDEKDRMKPEQAEVDDDRGTDVLGAARGAASGAAKKIRSGISAVRDVRAAAKRHSSARGRLKQLTETLEADEATLARREEVEAGYEGIVAEQSAIVTETAEEIARQEEAVERLVANRGGVHSHIVLDVPGVLVRRGRYRNRGLLNLRHRFRLI